MNFEDFLLKGSVLRALAIIFGIGFLVAIPLYIITHWGKF